MDLGLKGKKVIMSGGSHGIGLEALKLLTGAGESLSGRLLLLECLSMEWRSVRLSKDPACKVCADST